MHWVEPSPHREKPAMHLKQDASHGQKEPRRKPCEQGLCGSERAGQSEQGHEAFPGPRTAVLSCAHFTPLSTPLAHTGTQQLLLVCACRNIHPLVSPAPEPCSSSRVKQTHGELQLEQKPPNEPRATVPGAEGRAQAPEQALDRSSLIASSSRKLPRRQPAPARCQCCVRPQGFDSRSS